MRHKKGENLLLVTQNQHMKDSKSKSPQGKLDSAIHNPFIKLIIIFRHIL